ncbi:WYL domain-containing protein [Cognatishimia sp. SS12]|uniref:helix-turn-helix transcriptional regulator n=1 Tax=Cognatishimia sp. SS12 TaxID=2979465 RepID=UPI00232B75AE|nr:WYL domain-containing protein [Cognatishimia sp. SS12]MDC0737415.1 WYL domain-containing protein [Cognatishimia sp. SS12]
MPQNRRADRQSRLRSLMALLQDGTCHRAEDLAAVSGVSVRTIYRDMELMMANGLPISGTPGEGYRAAARVTLPPIHLTEREHEALHMGLAAIAASMEGPLAAAAETLAQKLDDALPDSAAGPADGLYATYPFADTATGFAHLASLRTALRARQRLRIRVAGDAQYDVRPLKLSYWGRLWTVICYCDTREDFVDLRVDQIADISILPGLFVEEPGKDLATYQRSKR